MTNMRIATTTLTALLAGILFNSAQAGSVNFGTGSNSFDMEFVTIGSPGNAPDTFGAPGASGSVDYTYQMGKFEVSEDMIAKYNSEFGNANGLTITTNSRGPDKPATSVSWNEAARFVNWLNTSMGGTAAYKFTTSGVNDNISVWTPGDAGYDVLNPFRNSLAAFVLPTVDEWYKAAYYNPNTSSYSKYPNGSNTLPMAVAGGTAANTAVYGSQTSPADITEAGGLSPFGIMGLGGNVFEWEETAFLSDNTSGALKRGLRGGDWANIGNAMGSNARSQYAPTTQSLNFGFRVAMVTPVPEPGSLALMLSGLAGLVWYRRRRINA